MWPGCLKRTVNVGVVIFTLLTAVTVAALTKGPTAGTIIPWMAEIGRHGRGTKGLWWAICGGAWLNGWSVSMKIVKIQIHAGPICQTRCCCIPRKGNVIVNQAFPGNWRGRVSAVNDPREYVKSLNPSNDVCNLLDPLLRRWDQKFAIQVSVWFRLLSFKIFFLQVSQINKLSFSDLHHQLLWDRWIFRSHNRWPI